MKFYLGTHMPGWLGDLDVPLFISRSRLAGRRSLPPPGPALAIDSGGFTELSQHGRWTTSPQQYAGELLQWAAWYPRLEWAAPQDRMCEPFVMDRVEQATGRRPTVAEHQEHTVQSVLDLRALTCGQVLVVPVLQGYTQDDYLACVDLYATAGIDLAAEPVVGVGSVCRRQHTAEIESVLGALHAAGLHNLHGFGVKTQGFARYGYALATADSLAWSQDARRRGAAVRRGDPVRPLPFTCHHGAGGTGNCANCPRYAMWWRDRMLASIPAQHRRMT